jgi:hypothetical protein
MYPKNSLQSLFWKIFNVFFNVKKWAKTQKNWNDVKVDIFFHVQLKVPYIQPFWTPLFNIGHEKQPFGYVMNFEILLTFIAHNKEL